MESGHEDSLSTLSLQDTNRPLPWRLSLIVVLEAILLAMGATVALAHPALLVSPTDKINGAVRIYAGYFASRNLALAMMLLAAMLLRARATLNVLTSLTAVIQVLDSVIDGAEGRWAVIPGVVALGVLFFVASVGLSGYPLWRKDAWR
jgi:hypothetical protein